MIVIVAHIERAVVQHGSVVGATYKKECFAKGKLSPDGTMLEMSPEDFAAIRLKYPRRCIPCEQKARAEAFEAKRKADHAKMLATLTEQHS